VREQVGGVCKVCGLEAGARVTRETARVVGCQILSARPYSPVFDSVSDPYLFFSSFFEIKGMKPHFKFFWVKVRIYFQRFNKATQI
jgi:hypothetical protein